MTGFVRHLLIAVLVTAPLFVLAIVATALLAVLTSTTRSLPGLVTVQVTDSAREFALAFQLHGQGILLGLLALGALVGLGHLALARHHTAAR